MEQLCNKIREELLEQIDFSRELSNDELQEMIVRKMADHPVITVLTLQERILLEQRVFNSLRRLGVLQELLEDDSVTEIMVNGPSQIFYEKEGRFWKYPYSFSSEEKLQDVIQQIVGKHNRVVNLSSPIVDTRLEDGSRVNVVLTPIAIDGSAISIRKFSKMALNMETLIEKETLSLEIAEFLKDLVKASYGLQKSISCL